jgi:hypothetical protein
MKKYDKQQKEMLPDLFMEFLQQSLIDKHDCPKDQSADFAETLIAGKKKVKDGDYALLELRPTLPADVDEKDLSEKEKEAVEIENEFICDALPCRLIGMNSQLMTQYIQFCADRLCVQLGYDKIYNACNPFDFMELISLEGKVNFFERYNDSYALATKTKDDSTFDLTEDF